MRPPSPAVSSAKKMYAQFPQYCMQPAVFRVLRHDMVGRRILGIRFGW
jgi:hypothetical protein